MEIDFLGLNSSNSCDDTTTHDRQSRRLQDAFTDHSGNGELVETSLSLSTSTSSLDFQKKRQTWEFPAYNIKEDEEASLVLVRPSAPVLLFQTSSTTVFPYDLNHNLQEKAADTNLYAAAAGNSSTGISGDARLICKRSGYIPTIAMARRATLARFLEKRLHRMNRAKASHLMRISSEICNRLPISRRP